MCYSDVYITVVSSKSFQYFCLKGEQTSIRPHKLFTFMIRKKQERGSLTFMPSVVITKYGWMQN